jgi:hypothetical protein
MLSRVDVLNSAWNVLFTPEPPVQAPEQYEGFKEVGQLSNDCYVCSNALFDLTQTDVDGNHPYTDKGPVVAHKRCPRVHKSCVDRMNPENLKQNGCPTCRDPLEPPPAPQQPPISLKEYAIYCAREGFSLGTRGVIRISGEVIYSLFWTAVVAGCAFALNVVVDAGSVDRLIAGPIIGGLVGSAFGAALVGGISHFVFGAGTHLVEKLREMAKVRFNRPARILLAVALSGAAAVLAWKVAFFAGNLLIAEWAKYCLPPNQIPTLLEFLWKITMDKGMRMGLSEPCVITLAQIELFAVASIAWGAITWARRVWNEELPRWRVAQA